MHFKLNLSPILMIVILLIACKNETSSKKINNVNGKSNFISIQKKITNLKDSKNNQVIVVAHRGDWRNAPENSLQAIQNCIDMGVDMVEIDIRETKDCHLVLMHDKTLDRTTNGKGEIK